MNLFEKDIAIDMGTTSTLVFEQGKGVVMREPTVVAIDKYNGKILKVGQEAQKVLGRTPADIVAIHPVEGGVISDYDMTAQMLRELISRITSFSFFKPCVLACVPSSISGVEERAMIDAAIEAGARKVYLLETAVATAMGAGIDISKADGHMIIDIGGGTTEAAVVSAGGVVECESIKVAGTSFDEAIVRYVRRKHNLLIGLGAAEEVKRSIGCVIQRPDVGVEEVKGRSLTNGLPKTVTITSNELIEAFVEPMNQILDAIHVVLERTLPQLVGDLDTNGIVMSGGGSLIYGIDRLIERSTGIRTIVVDDPVSCAAYGAGKMLKRLDLMQDGMMNFARKRQLK
ncbi:MAG: rod shape-determining protein [Oscillospiraceae bacterium]|nr:rod shape-determining protein [Oscillospiraceae bacterium]